MQTSNYGENEKLPKSIDLSHHLSDLAKARGISPLKGLFRYLGRPGMVALAGGVPNPDYFPFASLEAKTLPIDYYSPSATAEATPTGLSWFWNLFSGSSTKHMDHIAVPKYVADPIKDVNLATALQYGMATGVPPLQAFIKEYSARFYKPGYSDFTTLVHTGNTDGWSRVVYSLLNPGDSMLVEEWTYPSALAAALPIGVHTVAAPLDSRGIKPEALREILANWDEEARGFKRPRLLYTVPIGQNPSGLTTGSDRKKQIYDICVEFDVIIGEDDPYYILQEGEYIPEEVRLKSKGKSKANSDDIEEFIESLEPSYLRYDYQGRVIRMDTFSKTIAPGCRMGWFTCNPIFAERFERAGETSTQAPSGFTQSLVTQLIAKEWGLEGYVRWLKGIKAQYTIRRDLFIDSMMKELDVTLTKGEGFFEGATVYEGSYKGGKGKMDEKTRKKPVVSFVPPTSGMFVWIRVNFEGLPPPVSAPGENPNEATHEGRLWVELAENNLLIGPGFVFRGESEHPPEDPNVAGHYRISFSDASHETMEKACKIFAKVLKEYFDK